MMRTRPILGSANDPRQRYPLAMAETTLSLDQRLEEIGAQLAWVRDYL